LIDRGAAISAPAKKGWTPLHYATIQSNEEIVRMLIDDHEGLTPLHLAKREAVALLLINRGAAVSATDKTGYTPLHIAARDGREAIARLLIDGGALVSATDKKGSTDDLLAVMKNRGSCDLAIKRARTGGLSHKKGS
ncbi:ankyrin, partial [Wilcoxina mikolae CBS 423.85]